MGTTSPFMTGIDEYIDYQGQYSEDRGYGELTPCGEAAENAAYLPSGSNAGAFRQAKTQLRVCGMCPRGKKFRVTASNNSYCNKHMVKFNKLQAAKQAPLFDFDAATQHSTFEEAWDKVYPPLQPLVYEGQCTDDYRAFIGQEHIWVAKFIEAANTAYEDDEQHRTGDDLRQHENLIRQQELYNRKPHEESSKDWYKNDWVNVRMRFLFQAVLAFHQGGARVYPAGGSNNGYGEDNTLKMSERLAMIAENMRLDKRVVMDVVEGRGVCALAANPVAYEERKNSNNKCNAKKKRKLEASVGAEEGGEGDEGVVRSIENAEGDDDEYRPSPVPPKKRQRKTKARKGRLEDLTETPTPGPSTFASQLPAQLSQQGGNAPYYAMPQRTAPTVPTMGGLPMDSRPNTAPQHESMYRLPSLNSALGYHSGDPTPAPTFAPPYVPPQICRPQPGYRNHYNQPTAGDVARGSAEAFASLWGSEPLGRSFSKPPSMHQQPPPTQSAYAPAIDPHLNAMNDQQASNIYLPPMRTGPAPQPSFSDLRLDAGGLDSLAVAVTQDYSLGDGPHDSSFADIDQILDSYYDHH